MRKIAVINQKGGVGKTTTNVNLGAALASLGRRVLLLDLDPQAHLTMHFGHDVQQDDPTVYEVLTDRTPIAKAVRSVRDRVALVPAHTDLAGAEIELVNTVGREVILREALEPVGDDHDIMMIDCPPSLSLLTINALAAVDEVIIPLQTHFLGLQGLGKLLETMTLVRRRINPELKVSGIVLCMYDTGTRLAGEVVADLRGFLDGCRGKDHVCADARLFHTKVRRNIKLAEAPSFGQTIFDYAPQSNGAIDYLSLAAEVMLDQEVVLDDRAEARDEPTGVQERVEAVVEPVVVQIKSSHAEPAPIETEPPATSKIAPVSSASEVDRTTAPAPAAGSADLPRRARNGRFTSVKATATDLASPS